MNEELKPNMCKLKFACCDSPAEPCVYRSGHGINECRHRNDKTYECNSAIARVNAMVIELKKMGIDHQNREFVKTWVYYSTRDWTRGTLKRSGMLLS